ncbi:hypothetical protein [Saccharothrix longispora]|uniref:hypothetical protein n=1 Tax=Saccharothrix longispora TaxID=33920 RepID=UPI0028FDB9BA|nr:hypothetical protein [Saccharothrix longispora]MBY8847279.1 hypothetical protein [Saccharothrix sp. MB29]MDU0287658.1 hypothetical protein [Saccharothrix longispora]
MSDLRALHDAFAELERRADAVTAERAFESTSPAKSCTAPRPALVAAAVVVVAGAAAGTALLVPDDRPGTQVAASSTTDVPTADLATTASTPPAPPGTPEELAARLRAVLGGTATFTVTEAGPGAVVMTAPAAPAAGAQSTPPSTPGSTPPSTPSSTPAVGTQVGASIVGTLTADGITGGFHLIVYPGIRGEARCDGIPGSDCTAGTLPDGSSLTTQRTALQGYPTGVTQVVSLVRPDGVALILHVSNVTNPKGLGAQLADVPPLTVERMAGIVTSDLW